jgi:hypothetical protein
MTVFQFILSALACYRLTVLVTRDAGPFRMFARIRGLSPKWLGCPFCFSITAAFLIAVGFFFAGNRDSWVITACQILAMSAVTIMLDRVFTADHKT